jgi:hypothetical protein
MYDGSWFNPLKPMAADLGYHSPYPMYEGHEEWGGRMECDLLDGGVCYYDGSGLNAEEPWRILRHDGEAAFWRFMDCYWLETFELQEVSE